MIDSGNFGEWSWVCLGVGSLQPADRDSFAKYLRNSVSNSSSADNLGGGWMTMLDKAESIIEQQQRSLKQIAQVVMNSTLVVYSAAGKGINFSFN